LEDLVDHTVARTLDSFGYDWPKAKRWGEGPARGARSKKA
jgi:3-polyprenyl-4-hydroxybenzoate decarboxylase